VQGTVGNPTQERIYRHGEVEEILERTEAGLVRVLRPRDDIAIEKSADQIDEIQDAEAQKATRRIIRMTAGCILSMNWESRMALPAYNVIGKGNDHGGPLLDDDDPTLGL
jgi:hypothetical protein